MKICFVLSYVIDNIGYSDLFSRPHINQGSTPNLVSRSFHSDEGTCSSTIQNGKCIPEQSCCEGGEECYPAKKGITGEEAMPYPKMVAASCKPCPIGSASSLASSNVLCVLPKSLLT